MIDLLNLLPYELIAKVSEYAVSKTKRELSMVDQRTNAVVLDTVRCIRVFPPSRYSFQSDPSEIPEDILVKVIRRHTNLNKIIFGPPKNCAGSGEFGANEVPYLKSLISYLEMDHSEHPLSSVKKILFKEITKSMFGDFDEVKAKELNSLFLSSIGHRGLRNVRVKAYHIGSILTGTEIQPVLKNSPNLKTFVHDGFQSDNTVSLSFASHPHLSKVKLLNWKGPDSAIESLKNCKELEELAIDFSANYFNESNAIFLQDHLWNLKSLELKGMTLQNNAELDDITKKLPNLESLGVRLWDISDEGMELLGRNCPNLKILEFSNEFLTNSGLNRLTHHLPQLEIISFDLAYNITGDGIAAIARNCKNLRFIRVVHYKNIEKSGIDALAENCQNLKVVGFTHGGPISLEGMHDLVQQRPNLRYVELYSISDNQEEQIKEFYQKFPQVSKIPYTSSVKKLHNLTI